ncbi:MAG TPA: hypothetical protein VGP82_20135, partial [Ktedonobacterales bacterium]|nr:hypothetical protein [Ktedonobacterales bacterium]
NLDDLEVLYGKNGTQTMGGLSDLQSHPILDRGCLIGLWEYEVAPHSIVWATFGPPPPTLGAAVASMEAFIGEDLASGRSFALDDAKRQAPCVEALRRMAH